jgi:shikimate kinase
VLIGLSGSGKSTVGPLVAELLGRPFVDTDALIELDAGQSIPSIFEQRGESEFRAIEHRAVQCATEGPPAVIATGGGAPVATRNRALLWDGNFVVWLDASVETLVERLGGSGSGRPLLAGDPGGPGARLAGLLASRAPVYATAHLRVRTDELSPGAVAEQIVGALMRGEEQQQ